MVGGTFRLTPASPEPSTPRSTRSGAGARNTSRSGCRLPGVSFATRFEGPSAGQRIEAAGLKGTTFGGATVSREARQLHHRGQGRERPPTSAGWRTASVRRFRPTTASTCASRSNSSATGQAGRGPRRNEEAPDPHDVVTAATASADRRPARGPVGRTRRLDRLRDGDRVRPQGRRLPDAARPHRSRRRLVVAARGPRSERPAARGLRRARRARAPTARTRSARQSTGSPPSSRLPWCSSRSTAHSARTGRSRPCSRRRESPTRAPGCSARRSAWTRRCRSASGAGSGLPVARLARDLARALAQQGAMPSSRSSRRSRRAAATRG